MITKILKYWRKGFKKSILEFVIKKFILNKKNLKNLLTRVFSSVFPTVIGIFWEQVSLFIHENLYLLAYFTLGLIIVVIIISALLSKFINIKDITKACDSVNKNKNNISSMLLLVNLAVWVAFGCLFPFFYFSWGREVTLKLVWIWFSWYIIGNSFVIFGIFLFRLLFSFLKLVKFFKVIGLFPCLLFVVFVLISSIPFILLVIHQSFF